MLIPDNRDEFRRYEDPEPCFGPAPTALWNAFRQTLPFPDGAAARDRPIHDIAASFMREHPAASFIANDDREPDAMIRRHIEQ